MPASHLRRVFRGVVVATLAPALVASCDASGDAEGSAAPPPLDDGGGFVLLDGGQRSDGSAGRPPTGVGNPLCGESFCQGYSPDDPMACVGYDAGQAGAPSVAGAGGASSGGSGPTAGAGGLGGAVAAAGAGGTAFGGFGGADFDAGLDASTDGGTGDASPDVGDASFVSDAPVEAGTADVSQPPPAVDAAGGSGGSGGVSAIVRDAGGAPGDDSPPSYPSTAAVYGCQVAVEGRDVVSRCGLAGSGGSGAPCTSVRDCRPGFACVGEQTGQCLPYCCQNESSCGTGSWCADRPLRTREPLTVARQVPVCIPGDDCRLAEAADCDPTAGECTCPEVDEACSVVRSDGTTACIPVGTGESGDTCPCAVGYYCSDAKRCIKTCSTGGGGGQCGAGRCQATAGFPPGAGLCVGTTGF